MRQTVKENQVEMFRLAKFRNQRENDKKNLAKLLEQSLATSQPELGQEMGTFSALEIKKYKNMSSFDFSAKP